MLKKTTIVVKVKSQQSIFSTPEDHESEGISIDELDFSVPIFIFRVTFKLDTSLE